MDYLKKHLHTHRNFVRASNHLKGLGQPNSDSVEPTYNLVGQTFIFAQANRKMITKFFSQRYRTVKKYEWVEDVKFWFK